MESNHGAHTAKCQSCGRTRRFRTAEAAASAAPAGRICRARARDAAAAAEGNVKPGQHAKAVELIEDGGIVRTSRPGVYAATSSDGTAIYVVDTSAGTCTCKAGQNDLFCYHLHAALILHAAIPARRAA